MKAEEKGVIGDSIRGEGGGEDFLRYFNGKVEVLMTVPAERAFFPLHNQRHSSRVHKDASDDVTRPPYLQMCDPNPVAMLI